MDSVKVAIASAHARVSSYLIPTPVLRLAGSSHFLKLENQQPTGSFKVRGAVSKIASDGVGDAVIAASTGNHALAVGFAAGELGKKARVVVPATIADSKQARLDSAGIEILVHGDDCLDAESEARRLAALHGATYVSPYNDWEVVFGQASIMLELADQVPDISRIYVAVGGGGLCSGIGLACEVLGLDVEIVACSPERSCALHDSIMAGHVVPDKGLETLSDGTAGGVEENSITIPICTRHVSRWSLMSEDEIAAAVEWADNSCGLTVEGAAGVAIAAWMKDTRANEVPTGIIVCGGEPMAT